MGFRRSHPEQPVRGVQPLRSAPRTLGADDPAIDAEVIAFSAQFLDDLGINLKPARAMGMTTIKVTSAEAAIRDLGAVLGFE